MSGFPYILLTALIQVESGGKDYAIGDDGRSVGCLQMSKLVVDDVNRNSLASIGVRFSYTDRLDRYKACAICLLYLNYYVTFDRLGREPTIEDYARVWNGGPKGWKKSLTKPYWEKVEAELSKITSSKTAKESVKPQLGSP